VAPQWVCNLNAASATRAETHREYPTQNRLVPMCLFLVTLGHLATLWFAAFKILTILMVLLAILLISQTCPRQSNGPNQWVRRSAWAYGLVYLYMGLASIRAPDPVAALLAFSMTVVAIAPAFLLGQLAGQRAPLSSLVLGIAMMPIPFAIQIFLNSFQFEDPMLVGEYSMRSILGGLLCLTTPVAMAHYLATRRLGSMALVALGLVLALSIQSRSAILLVVPATVWVLLRQPGARIIHIASVGLVLAAVAAVALIAVGGSNRFSGENTNLDISDTIFEELTQPAEERVDFDRRLAAFVSTQLFLDHPILGSGYSSVLQTTTAEFNADVGSHGFVPGTAGELGLVGLTLIVAFLFRMHQQLKNLHTQQLTTPHQILAQGLGAGFWALVAYGFFHQTFESVYFALLIGILIGAMQRR
jgi:hypothetical protein